VTRIVYVNGAYKRYAEAAIHAEDRGFQFADAVYEVMEVRDGRLVDATRHMARLARSLGELSITRPMSDRALLNIVGEVVRRNRVHDGLVYIQVTRGAGPRNFSFPSPEIFPTLVVLARSQRRGWAEELAQRGIAVKTMSDIRWGRSDIKTVMLLPAVLAKDAAHSEGANEAWFVDASGAITEGASSNAWIVTAEGVLITRPLDSRILPGVTRATVKDVAAAEGLKIEERAFTLSEAFKAREAFVTSATNTIMPVVTIDGQEIGVGRPGPIVGRLRSRFHQLAENSIA